MFKIESMKDCDIIALEPGDGCKYQFIVINKDDDYLIISGFDMKFYGYKFRKDSIREFFETNGEPPKYEDYHKWASKILHTRNDYFSYVIDHCGGINCNPFTALVALYAGHIFLTAGDLP